ncbi:MAG: hypothetical protein ACD_73C00024G0001 [uncultured bacterium]|nr:MAG: hypothetical protein ACD_73C00024G0001 [uncultured bacterium]
MKPKALKAGDIIGIAAPASPFDPEEFHKGVDTLKQMGFQVYYRPDIFERKNYLAGSDQRRVEELKELFLNPEIKAIFFARGGYGMMRLLPHFKKEFVPILPKIILGYSDITSLLLHLLDAKKWITFYGPVVAKDLGTNIDQTTYDSLLETITSSKTLKPFSSSEIVTLKSGTANGVLTGGCLSLIVASLGTPYEIDTKDKILFMEDINEKPYAVDRMLTQLKLAGKLAQTKGIICGSFVNGGNTDYIREAIEDVLSDFEGPIVFNFPAGHGATKITLPLGIKVTLDADQKTLTFLEPCLEP